MSNRDDSIKKIASETLHKDIANLNVHLIDDLNMDSLDAISFLFEVEREFDIKIPEDDIDKNGLFHLQALSDYVSSKLNGAG